jgi:hypothetical protein
MSDPLNPMNPVGPPSGPSPVSPGPVYDESDNSRIYKISLGVGGFLLFVFLILLIVFYVKASRTTEFINQKVAEGKTAKDKEVRDACELEKKDIKENPWTDFKARDEFGAFKFVVPRNWSQYEYFDINANEPYSIYFSPDMVRYDVGTRKNHAALEVVVSKKVYTSEIKELKEKLKFNKDPVTEETINISNFSGSKFTYKDKDLNRRIGVIVLPYRDRALFIKTDDYDQWSEKYYTKFYQSFALTP